MKKERKRKKEEKEKKGKRKLADANPMKNTEKYQAKIRKMATKKSEDNSSFEFVSLQLTWPCARNSRSFLIRAGGQCSRTD